MTATKQREFGETLAVFFLAVAVVMLVARLFGWLAVKIAQPRVMGEVVAGIVLGPTLLGLIAPDLQAALFPKDIIPAIGVVANLGLIFYMFLVGLEIDPAQLKGRIAQAAAISNASVALPMMLGIAVALPDLRAGRARREVRRVRAVHGRGDVDHRLPGAGADPGGAQDAQAAGGRARRWRARRSTT